MKEDSQSVINFPQFLFSSTLSSVVH